jgi:hypothetical protein
MFCRLEKRSYRACEHFCKEESIDLYICGRAEIDQLDKDISHVLRSSFHNPLIIAIA